MLHLVLGTARICCCQLPTTWKLISAASLLAFGQSTLRHGSRHVVRIPLRPPQPWRLRPEDLQAVQRHRSGEVQERQRGREVWPEDPRGCAQGAQRGPRQDWRALPQTVSCSQHSWINAMWTDDCKLKLLQFSLSLISQCELCAQAYALMVPTKIVPFNIWLISSSLAVAWFELWNGQYLLKGA